MYRTEPIAKSTGGPFVLQADEPLKLRVFVDRSIIEVFANSRMVLTSRVYPTRNDCVHVGSFGARGTVRIWQMQPMWPVSRSIPGRSNPDATHPHPLLRGDRDLTLFGVRNLLYIR